MELIYQAKLGTIISLFYSISIFQHSNLKMYFNVFMMTNDLVILHNVEILKPFSRYELQLML